MNLDELRNLREQITNQPDQVTDEQLDAAISAIREHVAEARAARENGERPTPDAIAALEDLKGVREAVVSVQTARAEAAAKLDADAERLLSEVDIPDTPAQPDTDVDAQASDGGETGDAPTEQADAQQTPELVAASGALTQAIVRGIEQAFAQRDKAPTPAAQPQGRTGRPAPQPTPVGPTRDVATAKVYTGSRSAQGRLITSELDVAKAIHDEWRGSYQSRGVGRVPVLTVDTEFPDSRILGQDASQNFEKIRATTSPNALTAAGGLCAPLEVLYDIEVVGSSARPLRDALARFTVERGGLTYRPNSSGAAAVNGAGVWTMADDEAADTPDESPAGPTKACYVVDCPGLENAEVQAIYSCLEFSNITTRFDPESTTANVTEAMIAHSRVAENELYNAMAADSKLIHGAQVVGATRDILVNLDKSVAYYRNRHRIDDSLALTFVLPAWVRYLIRADLARQMAAGDWPEALGVSDQMMDGWFSRRGVTPVWWLDGSTAAATVNGQSIPRQTYDVVAAGSPIPAFPAKIDSLLFATGSFLFLDGGSLDLGLVRDSELNSRNRYRMFSETFEGVAARGIEPLRLLMAVHPKGSAVGTVDPATVTS